jgi:hypothetical protein
MLALGVKERPPPPGKPDDRPNICVLVAVGSIEREKLTPQISTSLLQLMVTAIPSEQQDSVLC